MEDISKARASAGKERANVSDSEKPKEENKRICKKCGKNPTMAPQTPYCSPCMRLLAQEARDRKKASSSGDNAAQEGKIREAPRETPSRKTKAAPAAGETTVRVDFGAHADLLREIKGLAEEEIRPLDLQIIYVLKSHLKGLKPVEKQG